MNALQRLQEIEQTVIRKVQSAMRLKIGSGSTHEDNGTSRHVDDGCTRLLYVLR